MVEAVTGDSYIFLCSLWMSYSKLVWSGTWSKWRERGIIGKTGARDKKRMCQKSGRAKRKPAQRRNEGKRAKE